MDATSRRLVDAAADRYRPLGRWVHGFVRGKIRYDPVYLTVIRERLLPLDSTVVDLGCGSGILLSLLAAAQDAADGEGGPATLETVRQSRSLRGIEIAPKAVAQARAALGHLAVIDSGDLATAAIPPCGAAVLLDVLHYLDANGQETLLDRLTEAVAPGGVLLVREVDAARGGRAWVTRAAERARAWGRGAVGRRFCYRGVDDWCSLLEQRGFVVEVRPMDAGTPFANVLLRAERRRIH